MRQSPTRRQRPIAATVCPPPTSTPDPTSEVDCGPSAAGTRSQGLVSVPERASLSRLGSWVAGFALLATLVVVVGTTVIDLVWPLPPPALIGGEKIQDERLRAAANVRDGSWARLLERDYRLRSRVRASTGGWYSTVLFRYLCEGNDQVTVGARPWLYLTDRIEPPKDVLSRASSLGWIAATLAAVERRLRALGIEDVLIPVPRKAALYAEGLPRNLHPDPAFDQDLMEELRKRGVDFVDLGEAFREHVGESLYFPYESHWTPLAEKLAAELAARRCGRWIPEEERSTRIRSLGPGRHQSTSDLLQMLGVTLDEEEMPSICGEELSTFVVVDRETGKPVKRIPCGPTVKGKIVVCGTSFTVNRDLPYFLSHYIGAPVANAAAAGAFGLQTLRDLLRARTPEERPELVFQELPVFQTFKIARNATLPAEVCDLFGENSPPSVLLLRPGADYRSPQEPEPDPADRSGGAWRTLATIPAGRVAHSGTGAVSLRLRSRHPELPARMRITTGTFSADLDWKAGTEELVFPLLDWRAGSPAVTIAVRGAPGSSFELAELDLVSEVRREGSVALALDPAGAVPAPGGTWQQLLTAPAGCVLPARGALVLRRSGERVEGVSAVILECADGRTFTQQLDHLAPGALIVLDPSGLAGETLERVRLRGFGAPSRTFVDSAELFPPP